MRKQVSYTLLALSAGLPAMPAAIAGEADVVAAEAIHLGNDVWRFTATVRHADEGWDHYANSFEVVGPDGTVLGVRTLYHPHVDEQPFTRSLGNVKIDPAVQSVQIRAGDSVHGMGGKQVTVKLQRD